jgi:hypothetical protein
VAPRARVASRLSELDARVRAHATQPVETVVHACEHGAGAEAVGDEVDRPQHDRLRAAVHLREEPARARERVEPEPRADAWQHRRDERVERERERRPQREPNRTFVSLFPVGVRRDHVTRPLLGRQRVRDRDPARAARDEEVAQRLRRSVAEAVRDDREVVHVRRCARRAH